VVTDIAPFRALTLEGTVGALWEPGRADALTAALQRVVSRPLEPQRQLARETFARAFSWPMIGTRANAIYREVTASRGLARASMPARTPASAPPRSAR
jgi:glycosyltransferase involved in cell wall biosynthesis